MREYWMDPLVDAQPLEEIEQLLDVRVDVEVLSYLFYNWGVGPDIASDIFI